MTAHAMKGDRERCLESGMDAYVSKPVRPHDIAEALGRFFPADGSAPVESPASRTDVSSVPPGDGDGSAIDWRLALMATQGDQGLLREVAEVCSMELPTLRNTLAEALGRGDAGEVMRLAHTIKGNLRTFGAIGIPHAEGLEQAGRSGDLQSAPGLLQLLSEDVARVEQALADYLRPPAAQ
jgi:CheY-like chemotaxis protein